MVSSVRVCDTNRCVVRLAFSRLGKNNNLSLYYLTFHFERPSFWK